MVFIILTLRAMIIKNTKTAIKTTIFCVVFLVGKTAVPIIKKIVIAIKTKKMTVKNIATMVVPTPKQANVTKKISTKKIVIMDTLIATVIIMVLTSLVLETLIG